MSMQFLVLSKQIENGSWQGREKMKKLHDSLFSYYFIVIIDIFYKKDKLIEKQQINSNQINPL